MQSAFFKLLYFWSSVAPRLISASGEDVWQGLGIDFGKGSVHIPKYVTDKLLETNPSPPVCLFMWLRHLAPNLSPNSSFTWAMAAVQHVWLLSSKRCQQTKSAHGCSSFGSIFIWTFIPQAHTEKPCARLGGMETWSL